MDLERLVNNYIVEDDEDEAFTVAKQIARTSSLLEMVRALEDPLTQDDAAVRSKATQCLTDVIKSLKHLHAQEIAVLATFLVDRVEDFASVGAAADGLIELVARPQFSVPDALFWEKLQNINMLDLDQPVRLQVFQLLDALSSQSAAEFVPTFVMLASGEKDPQNLMVSLKISQYVLAHYGPDLAQDRRAEVYDITFCYFPITFNPPKDMPVLINADEIREQLRMALKSPAIAEWVVPGLIGKLTAVNVTVRVDALVTLGEVAKELQKARELAKYWTAIWEGVRFEVLHGTPQSETHAPAISLLAQLVDIPDFLEAVKREFKAEDLPHGKLTQLCNLVIGISSSEAVWDEVAPPAVEKSLESAELLGLFLAAPYPIMFSDRVLQALLVSLANGEKRDSTNGLKLLALKVNEFAPLIVQTLTQEKAYSALAELAQTHAETIKDHCIPQLLSELPLSLEALGTICRVRSLVHVLTVRLLSRLEFDDPQSAMAYLSTLVESSGHLGSNAELTGYDRILIGPLFAKLEAAHSVSEELIDIACILVERAARGVGVEHQPEYAATVLSKLDRINFHLIVSAVAAMQAFPFAPNFLPNYVLPKLAASTAVLDRAACLRTIALTANKWPDHLELSTDDLRAQLESGDLNATESFAWLSKGLLFRADSQGFENAAYLTRHVNGHPAVAKIYGVLLAPDRVVAKENGCIVRPLFRQRVFVQNLGLLSASADSSESLVALSGLLKYTPQSVVAAQFQNIVPLLLAILRVRSARVQAVALQSLCDSLPESAAVIEPYLESILPVLLDLAVSGGSADVRVSAIKTLIALHAALTTQLKPYTDEVLESLVPALGDKKRDVRKYAVTCRQAFF